MRKYFLLLLVVFVESSFSRVEGQNKSDICLLTNTSFRDIRYEEKRVVVFGITRQKKFLAKYNPVTLAFSSLMYTYQKVLSQQISASCLYQPSCSEYSRLLFNEFGFLGGLISTSDRLMRCDRISATSISSSLRNEKDGKVHEDVTRYLLK